MLGLAATPKSHLKQPARVPVEGSRCDAAGPSCTLHD
jgi:hypothetical protein